MVGRRRDERNPWNGMAQAGNERADLGGRYLSTFAGFTALRHLDFKFDGARKIFRRYPEPRRGNLLGGRVGAIAMLIELPPVGIFATFARVRLATDSVHGDGDGRVCLRTERA